MHPSRDLPPSALRLIDDQAGVVAVWQLSACGLSPKVIRRFTLGWRRLARGIYLTRHPEWLSAVWAGLLRGGRSAVVGGLAACFLEKAVRDAPAELLIWAPQAMEGFEVGPWRVGFRRGTPSGFGSPVRTRIHDSLLDVANTHNAYDTIATVTSAFARQVAHPSRLLPAAQGRRRLRHRSEIETLCDPSAQGVHSLIEWLFLRDVIRAHGLPEPELQVSRGAGRVDEHFSGFATIVELDGMRDHSDWSKDMMRDNEHLLEDGSMTLRYGLNATMRQHCEASRQLARRFRRMGWRGEVRSCRRCPVR